MFIPYFDYARSSRHHHLQPLLQLVNKSAMIAHLTSYISTLMELEISGTGSRNGKKQKQSGGNTEVKAIT